MRNILLPRIIWCMGLLSQILACGPSPSSVSQNSEKHLAALLASQERQRAAHLEGDATAFVAEFSDTVLILQDGEVFLSPRKAMEEQFQHYFSRVHYTSWDDVQKPILQFSEDSTRASVYVQKLLDVQTKDSSGAWGPHQFSLYSWDSDFIWKGGRWLVSSNTSGQKPLSEEAALALTIHTSDLYDSIPEKALVAEGVAYDPRTQITYVSSTYKQKIVALGPDGQIRDFKKSHEDDLWSPLGMEVDTLRDLLWVISSNAHEVMPMQIPQPETEWTSRIYSYDLSSGSLRDRYEPNKLISGPYCFNDLTVSTQGEVFISESVQNRIYRLNSGNGEFEVIPLADTSFIFPNGVTLSTDERFLYVAYRTGIKQISLSDGRVKDLETPEGILPHRVDGLAYYQGTLIGNQPFRKRILQFSLNEEQTQITSQRILEANHPYFDQPTSGEVAGDHFIYLANAQLASAFLEGVIRGEKDLEPTYLMRVSLAHTSLIKK